MPIMTRFPGGGGASGYRYQSRDADGITYTRDGDGILLKWTDPEDILLGGSAISEWKGTIVVCKEGSAPQSVDDGVIICDSTVRDQYRENGLHVDVGGPGYYYGIFPYTKDYVVNVDSANTVYILNEDYDIALENASWSDIAYIVAQGRAAQVWNVGDRKDIVLYGDYNGSVTMQIAGFDHDDAVGGGKAGISFLSEQLAIKPVPMDPASTSSNGWGGAHMRTTTMPKIRSSLPQTVRDLIKKVKKIYTPGKLGGRLEIAEDDLFIPSCTELGKEYKDLKGNGDEGIKYPIFMSDTDLIKKDLYGNAGYWWLRSVCVSGTQSFGVVGVTGGLSYAVSSAGDVGVCFGFCI